MLSRYYKFFNNNKCSLNIIFISKYHLKNVKKTNEDFVNRVLCIKKKNVYRFLESNQLLSNTYDDLNDSYKMLRSLNYSKEEIITYPGTLMSSGSIIENRHKVLTECGFEKVKIFQIALFVRFMRSKIESLRKNQFISADTDIFQCLLECIDLNIKAELPILSDQSSLTDARKIILSTYLIQKLNIERDQFETIWLRYRFIRYRSLNYVSSMLNVLSNYYKFDKKLIFKNSYLLNQDYKNSLDILRQIPKIAGKNIIDLVHKFPLLLLYNCGNILKVIKCLAKYEIPETHILVYTRILSMNPDTLEHRLSELSLTEELHALKSNPSHLMLVYKYVKATQRIDYFRKNKIKCMSLYNLVSGSVAFKRRLNSDADRTTNVDLLEHLAYVLKKTENEIRTILQRHPYWSNISLVSIVNSLKYLQENFTVTEIYPNMYLLLYPVNKIKSKLKEIELQNYDITKSQILSLCLYLIEVEYHFTGDGVWADNLWTESLEKDYSLSAEEIESSHEMNEIDKRSINT